jgi:hypothetical protein
VRAEFRIAAPRSAAELDAQVELVWGLHAAIFYLGVRKSEFDLSQLQSVQFEFEK